MDSIDCGEGSDLVYVNRGDRVFNCEAITCLARPSGVGHLRMGTSGDDVLNELEWQWRGSDRRSWRRIDYLNGHAGADLIVG